MTESRPADLRPGQIFNRHDHPLERLMVDRVEELHLAARDPREPDDSHVTVYVVHTVGGGAVRVTSDDILTVRTNT